ncbi:hypothetical protein O9992_10245 [Vibrio lentus]|nr:hypothetical protein [Vibrio lentus]
MVSVERTFRHHAANSQGSYLDSRHRLVSHAVPIITTEAMKSKLSHHRYHTTTSTGAGADRKTSRFS